MAVCLRLAAGGSVAGVGEAALRALTKLDQVLPARLRSQVGAIHEATVTLTRDRAESVEPDVLMTLARACRDREHVTRRVQRPRRRAHHRRVEPYQLVTTGRRWYVMAYDRDRARLAQPAAGPDVRRARAWAARSLRARRPTPRPTCVASISASPYPYVAKVRYSAPLRCCGAAFFAGRLRQ